MLFASLKNHFFSRLAPNAPRNHERKVQTANCSGGEAVDSWEPGAHYVTPQKYLDGAQVPTFYQFQSNMVTDEDLQPGMNRQLEVDKRLTVPTRTHIRFLATSGDVLHSWAVPSLGLKADSIPGKIVRHYVFIQREGVFYGQCSEI